MAKIQTRIARRPTDGLVLTPYNRFRVDDGTLSILTRMSEKERPSETPAAREKTLVPRTGEITFSRKSLYSVSSSGKVILPHPPRRMVVSKSTPPGTRGLTRRSGGQNESTGSVFKRPLCIGCGGHFPSVSGNNTYCVSCTDLIIKNDLARGDFTAHNLPNEVLKRVTLGEL